MVSERKEEMWNTLIELQGMTLVPSVTELILAELLYLQYEDKNKPVQLYINSTGSSKVGVYRAHDRAS